MPIPYLLLPPDQISYNAQLGQEFISVKLDGGLSFHRRDKLSAAAMLSLTWQLTEDQFRYFMAFYRTTLKGGSLFFSLDLIIDRPDARRHTCHFISPPNVTGVPGLLRVVSAQVEAIPEFENVGENTDVVNAVELATSVIARIRFYEGFAKDYGPDDKQMTFQPGINAGAVGKVQQIPPDGRFAYDATEGTDSSYLSIGGSPFSSVEYTAMLWFYTEVAGSFSSSNQYLLWGDGGVNDFQLWRDPSGGSIAAAHGAFVGDVSTPSPVSALAWHHAAVTYKLSPSQTMELYIDGVLQDTATAVGTVGAPTFLRLMGNGVSGDSTCGYADDVIIMRRVLTPLEIQNYYNTGELPSR